MSGICGWMGKYPSLSDAGMTIERMGHCLGGAQSEQAQVLRKQGCAIGKGSTARVGIRGDVIVAITGYPMLPNTDSGNQLINAISETYLECGTAFLDRVHGPFSIAVLDLRDDSALLAIDRLGIESLSYAVSRETLVFGSRADTVTMHPLVTKEIDPQSIYDYLYFHCVPSPRSIYSSQQKLLPGQLIRYRNGKLSSRLYWKMDYQDDPAPFASLREDCMQLLESAVHDAAGNDNPGTFLSGGIDSSTVTGMLSKINGGSTRTFSIGFQAQGYDEMEYARIAARHFSAQPREYYVTPQDVVDAIPLIAKAYDEPFGNASAVPTYYCALQASQSGMKSLLAGDGGDEIFAGNARYAQQLLLEQYARVPGILRRTLLEPLAFSMPGSSRFAPLRKLSSYINQARIPLPDRLETYNFLNRNDLADIFSGDFLSTIDTEEPLRNLRDAYSRAASESPLNQMLNLDLKITLADNDLRKVNRMCEIAGVTVRYPMLDERLVEFAARVPPGLKLRHFRLRYFFKQALRDFLPKEILTKRKQGFGLPFGVWLQNHQALQEVVNDSLTTLKGRGYINPHYIDNLLVSHRDEHSAYYGVMIWVLMMLEQWLHAHDL